MNKSELAKRIEAEGKAMKKTVDAIARRAVKEAFAAALEIGLCGESIDSVLRRSFAEQVEKVLKQGI